MLRIKNKTNQPTSSISVKRKRSFKTLSCSTLKNHSKQYTCYDNKTIMRIRDLWNKRHPDDPIKTKNTKSIWKILRDKMNGLCDNEICWLKKIINNKTIIDDMLSRTFSPIAPETWKRNKNTWLSNFDISNVMKQYEKKYSNFRFIGPTPMDFDKIEHENVCVWDDLCKFDLKKMIDKKIDKIGIIFNTDVNTGPGKHWTSMFICIKNRMIYYFNSSGSSATQEIMKLVQRIKKQGESLGIHFKFDQNHPKQHQYSDSECGMYSIYFIVNMLTGELNPETLKKTRIPDSKMVMYRDIFFNII